MRSSPPSWRTAILLLGLAYALTLAAHLLAMAIENGAPGWLNLAIVVLAWDTIKIGCLAAPVVLRGIHGVIHRLVTRFCDRPAIGFVGSTRV